jgi:hypothetical protein
VVVVGRRRVPVERPRGRTVAGDKIELATYAAFSNDALLSQVVMEWMLAGEGDPPARSGERSRPLDRHWCRNDKRRPS